MSESIEVPDVDRGYELYITITVFTVAIVVTTTARVIIKFYFRYRLGVDDWFIILGTVRTPWRHLYCNETIFSNIMTYSSASKPRGKWL
jgi:hypothetical protein